MWVDSVWFSSVASNTLSVGDMSAHSLQALLIKLQDMLGQVHAGVDL